jgi:hypothetical protein
MKARFYILIDDSAYVSYSGYRLNCFQCYAVTFRSNNPKNTVFGHCMKYFWPWLKPLFCRCTTNVQLPRACTCLKYVGSIFVSPAMLYLL